MAKVLKGTVIIGNKIVIELGYIFLTFHNISGS